MQSLIDSRSDFKGLSSSARFRRFLSILAISSCDCFGAEICTVTRRRIDGEGEHSHLRAFKTRPVVTASICRTAACEIGLQFTYRLRSLRNQSLFRPVCNPAVEWQSGRVRAHQLTSSPPSRGVFSKACTVYVRLLGAQDSFRLMCYPSLLMIISSTSCGMMPLSSTSTNREQYGWLEELQVSCTGVLLNFCIFILYQPPHSTIKSLG